MTAITRRVVLVVALFVVVNLFIGGYVMQRRSGTSGPAGGTPVEHRPAVEGPRAECGAFVRELKVGAVSRRLMSSSCLKAPKAASTETDAKMTGDWAVWGVCGCGALQVLNHTAMAALIDLANLRASLSQRLASASADGTAARTY